MSVEGIYLSNKLATLLGKNWIYEMDMHLSSTSRSPGIFMKKSHDKTDVIFINTWAAPISAQLFFKKMDEPVT